MKTWQEIVESPKKKTDYKLIKIELERSINGNINDTEKLATIKPKSYKELLNAEKDWQKTVDKLSTDGEKYMYTATWTENGKSWSDGDYIEKGGKFSFIEFIHQIVSGEI